MCVLKFVLSPKTHNLLLLIRQDVKISGALNMLFWLFWEIRMSFVVCKDQYWNIRKRKVYRAPKNGRFQGGKLFLGNVFKILFSIQNFNWDLLWGILAQKNFLTFGIRFRPLTAILKILCCQKNKENRRIFLLSF